MANTGKIAKKTRKLEGKLDAAMHLLGVRIASISAPFKVPNYGNVRRSNFL